MTDSDLDEELAQQLRRWADDLATAVPPYRHTRATTRVAPITRRRSVWLATAAVVATVAIGAGVLWRAHIESNSRVTTQGAAIMVRHERIEVRISATLSCAPIDASATFDHATVDTWADTTSRRYRTRVTYPDGSTYDVIALGSPYYPTELYEQGQSRLGPLGCAGDKGFSIGGAGATIYSLNALAETPLDANGNPLVLGLLDTTTPVAGAYADSLGRPADLRQEVITGRYSGNGLTLAPIIQTTRVFVDPATGEINEATYINEIDGLGRLDRIATRTLSAVEPAAEDLFDHGAYTPLPVRSPPTESGPPPTTPRPNPPSSTI